MACSYDAVVTVRNGQVVKVDARESMFNKNAEYKAVEKENWITLACNYTKFTVPQVLADVSEALEKMDPVNQRSEITFDSENGYVTHYGINYRAYGLFTSVVIYDCCPWYEFSDYEVLK